MPICILQIARNIIIIRLDTSPTDNQLSLSENMAELRVLLSGVGVSKQTALRCFSHEQGALAVEHLSSSLFQHYRLFQCLFSEEQELEEMSSNVSPRASPCRCAVVIVSGKRRVVPSESISSGSASTD